MVMSPSVMSIRRLTIFIAVVFPPPEGPTSTQISPAGTTSDREFDGGLGTTRVALRDVVEDEFGGAALAPGGLVSCGHGVPAGVSW